jgi:hypothetical protein
MAAWHCRSKVCACDNPQNFLLARGPLVLSRDFLGRKSGAPGVLYQTTRHPPRRAAVNTGNVVVRAKTENLYLHLLHKVLELASNASWCACGGLTVVLEVREPRHWWRLAMTPSTLRHVKHGVISWGTLSFGGVLVGLWIYVLLRGVLQLIAFANS